MDRQGENAPHAGVWRANSERVEVPENREAQSPTCPSKEKNRGFVTMVRCFLQLGLVPFLTSQQLEHGTGSVTVSSPDSMAGGVVRQSFPLLPY